MATIGRPNQATDDCPQCEQYLDEIARLRDELSTVREASSQAKTGSWWRLVALAALLLVTIPNVPLIVLEFATGGSVNGWIGYAIWGASLGLLWLQWSFIGIFCMLLDMPLSRKTLLYLGLGSMAGVTTFVVVILTDIGNRDLFLLGYASPFLSIVIASPVFLTKLLCRWTLIHRNSKAIARAVSLGSFLTLMTILGVALATMKFFPWRDIASDLSDASPYFLVFGGPLLAVGFLHLWMLPKFLGQGDRRAVSWRQWLSLGVIVFVGIASSVGGFVVYLTVAEQFNWNEVAHVSAIPIALLLSSTLVMAAGYFLVRRLDYELRTMKGERESR